MTSAGQPGAGAKRLVFLGPPGAGKGTQAKLYASAHGVPQVSTGDMLRSAVANGTPAGRKAAPIMASGGLVPDEIVLACVEERLDSDASKGFILDGYPRNVQQAGDLDRILAARGVGLDAVVNFEIAPEVVVSRIAGRRVAPKSGRIYHVSASPPRVDGRCDATGEELVQRPDDREDVVRERLRVYADKTEPLVAHYRGRGLLAPVAADGPVEEVFRRLERALSSRAR